MVGPLRPQIVLFGSSIVQLSYSDDGWGSILTNLYSRKADIILRGYCGWNSRRAVQVLDTIFPKFYRSLYHATNEGDPNQFILFEYFDYSSYLKNHHPFVLSSSTQNAAEQPTLVIVYFGGNDSIHPHPSGLGPHVPLEEYIENMRKIINHLKSLSKKTRIILLSSPPVNEAQIHKSFSNILGPLKRTNESCRLYSEACMELCHEMNVKAIDLWSALQQREDWSDVCFTDGIHLSHEGSKIVAKEILKVLEGANWEPSLHWKSMPNEFAEDSLYDPVAVDEKTTVNVSNWSFQKNSDWERDLCISKPLNGH